MDAKKIILIILLVAIVGGVAFVLINSNGKKELKGTNSGISSNRKISDETGKNEFMVSELEDGTLYSKTILSSQKADIVIGDKFFDTQLADINKNFSTYEGKTIEIEGFHLSNGPYTFVGRYSTSNLCAYCPVGYSYFEYQWNASNKPELTDSQDWIKVIGTLKKDFDKDYNTEFYYIDVISVEIMKERGQETVSD